MCQGCVGNIFGALGGLRLGLSRRQFFATAAGATAIAPMAPARAASGDGADLIFHGGPVIPLAGFGQYAEALAVKNGKIIAVGTSDAVMGLKSNSTQFIDLGGRAAAAGIHRSASAHRDRRADQRDFHRVRLHEIPDARRAPRHVP